VDKSVGRVWASVCVRLCRQRDSITLYKGKLVIIEMPKSCKARGSELEAVGEEGERGFLGDVAGSQSAYRRRHKSMMRQCGNFSTTRVGEVRLVRLVGAARVHQIKSSSKFCS
jgi:hypothetical protein